MRKRKGERVEREGPLAHRAVRGGLWVAGCSYFAIVIGFLANIYLARTIDVVSYGVYALASATAGLVTLQSYFGLRSAFVQHGDRSTSATCTFAALEMGLAISGVLVFLIASPLIRRFYSGLVAEIGLIVIGLTVIRSISHISRTVLERDLLFRQSGIVHAVSLSLSYIPAFYLAASGYGVWALVGQSATAAILATTGILFALRWQGLGVLPAKWEFDSALARTYLKAGGALGFNAALATLRSQLTVFIGGTILGERQLGFINRAARTSGWNDRLFRNILGSAGFYTFAALQNDRVRLERAFAQVIWFTINASVPISLLLITAAPDLLEFLYTDKWLRSAPLIRILAAFSVLSPISFAAGRLLTALGQYRVLITTSGLSLISFLLYVVPFVLLFEMEGLCVAIGLTQATVCTLMFSAIHKKIGFTWRIIPLRPFFVGVVCLTAYYLLNRIYPVATLTIFIRLLLKCGYVALTYSLLIYAFHGNRIAEQFRYALRLMRGPQEAKE